MGYRRRRWTALLFITLAAVSLAAIYVTTFLSFEEHRRETQGDALIGVKDQGEATLASLEVTFGPTYLVSTDGTIAPVAGEVHPTHDLVELDAHRWSPLAEGAVPSGTYAGVLLTFEAATLHQHVPDLPDALQPDPIQLQVPDDALLVHVPLEVDGAAPPALLLDLDLEESVDTSGTTPRFTPHVQAVHLNLQDTDDDGLDDVMDWDDDGDGVPDWLDEDKDGDGRGDAPSQERRARPRAPPPP